MSKVLAYMLPYAAWSPVPVRLLEKGGAPAVRLVVAALSSASLGDVTATSNVEAGLRTFIQAFQVGVALEAHISTLVQSPGPSACCMGTIFAITLW